jgi:hypothetical protein
MDWMQEAYIRNQVCFFSVANDWIRTFIRQTVNRFMARFEYMLSATTRTRTKQQIDWTDTWAESRLEVTACLKMRPAEKKSTKIVQS